MLILILGKCDNHKGITTSPNIMISLEMWILASQRIQESHFQKINVHLFIHCIFYMVWKMHPTDSGYVMAAAISQKKSEVYQRP